MAETSQKLLRCAARFQAFPGPFLRSFPAPASLPFPSSFPPRFCLRFQPPCAKTRLFFCNPADLVPDRKSGGKRPPALALRSSERLCKSCGKVCSYNKIAGYPELFSSKVEIVLPWENYRDSSMNQCQRCNYTWNRRVTEPKRCPSCKSAYWNQPRRSPKKPAAMPPVGSKQPERSELPVKGISVDEARTIDNSFDWGP